jgi:hypothetical protein
MASLALYPTTGLVGNSTTAAAANLAIINAALTAGRTCIIAPGANYYVNGTILIPSYCTLDSRGATLTLANGSSTWMVTNSDTTNGNTNIKVIGGTWDFNQANNPVTAPGTEPSWVGHNLCFTRVSNLEIAHCRFLNGGPKFTIATRGGSNIWIHDNTAGHLYSDGWHHTATGPAVNANIVVERNNWDQTDDDPFVVGIGDWEGYNVSGGVQGSVENLVIRDNYVGTTTNSIKLFIDRTATLTNNTNPFYFSGVQITGNHITSTGSAGVVIDSSTLSGHLEANVITGCVIADNYLAPAAGDVGAVQIGWYGDTVDIEIRNNVTGTAGSFSVFILSTFLAAKSNITINGIKFAAGITPTKQIVYADVGSKFGDITIRDLNYTGSGAKTAVQISSITCNSITLENCRVDVHGLVWWYPATAAGTHTASSNTMINITQCASYGTVGTGYPMRADSTCTINLAGLAMSTATNSILVNATAGNIGSVTLLGSGASYPDGAALRPLLNAGTLRLSCPDFKAQVPTDVNGPVGGDVCFSTGGSVTGRAIYIPTAWQKWGWA